MATADISINTLSPEVLTRIMHNLDSSSRMRAAFTCVKWLQIMKNVRTLDMKRPFELDVYLDDHCHADVFYRSAFDTRLSFCQCYEHYRSHLGLLRHFIEHVGDTLNALLIEDSLAKGKTQNDDGLLYDSTVFSLLKMCGKETTRLCFKDVNLSSVRYWTLLLMARFEHLRVVEFASCQFPTHFAERFLSAILMNSARTLTSITITETGLIGDKFCTKIARNCLALEELNVTGCILVTQNTVVAFCEALALGVHQAISVNLNVSRTAFNGTKLYAALQSGQLTCGPCWTPRRVTVGVLGYDKDVLLVQKTDPNVIIVVYL
ncbi:hypothetical protein QR680_012498 [Steinernema hermaphroditum]|uniref:F-box domain-containing protein n=1 Tax=Steinernema hermaphroditum TaxID=289476 RepID=A0AA39I4S0_9BILA|nr:hypothetical protein QR680_012498 [Steinernema hermaphroditum]